MADERKPKERKKVTEPENQAGTPTKAKGKSKGSDAEKAASPAAIQEPAAREPAATRPQTKSSKVPKLEKKNKSRLPRRQKKAHQKLAATQVQA